jgi:AraC-like DNA-binding protein
MKEGILQIISLFTVLLSCLLAGFLLTVKTERRLSNTLFGAFILLNAADISSWFVNDFLLDYPRLLLFKSTLNALINPAFYLYVVAVCYADFRLRPRHLAHLVPFGVLTLVMLPRFYLTSPDAQLDFLRHYGRMTEATFSRVLGHLQFGFYLVASFRTLIRYQRTYVEYYTDPANRTYRWLLRLVISLTGLHVLVLVKEGLRFTPYQQTFTSLELWVGLNATLILCWWLLQALHHPELFRRIDSSLEPVQPLRATAPETAYTPIRPASEAAPVEPSAPSEEVQEQVRRLRHYMEQAQPHLDPSLTIQDLAQQLQLPTRELSLLINHHLDQHFFDFVNEYRIQHSMRLLKDPAQRERTVLDILYAVGFNSKSSFNTSFKKLTGQTPSQYRGA